MLGLVILLCILALLQVVVLGFVIVLQRRLELLQDDVSAIRLRSVPPAIGGRMAPTHGELQSARNRMDAQGTAHWVGLANGDP